MMNVRTLASRLAVVAVLFFAAGPLSATVYTAQTSGDFHTAANYSPQPTGAFTAADDIIVNQGVSLTLTQAGTTTVRTITFNSGGGSSITINGGATLSVTGTSNNGFGVEFNDPSAGTSEVVVKPTGTLSVTNAVGLFGGTSGFTKLRSTGGTIQAGSLAFNGVNPSNGVIDLSTGSGTFQLTFGSLPSGGSIIAGIGSTFELSGSATMQTFGGYTFHNLKINKSAGNAQLNAAIDVNGTLNVAQGTFATNGFNATVDGAIFGSGAINMSSGGALSVGGDFHNHTGTFTSGIGSVTYNGGAAQAVRSGTYNVLTFSVANTNGLLAGAVTTNSLTVSSGAYFGLTSHNLTVGGNVTVDGSINSSGGTLIFSGATGTINGGGLIGANTTTGTRTISSTSTIRFTGNVTISNGSTITNNGAIDIDNSLDGVDTASTWTNAANSTLTVGGHVFSTAGNLNASATGNTVTYDGLNQSIFNTATYHHLVFTASSPAVKSYTTAGTLTINSTLTISGQATVNASSPISVGGAVSIASAAKLDAGSFNLTVGGDWTKSGVFIAGTSTVTFNGSGAQNISASPFWSVTFSGSGPKTLTGAIDVGDDFTIATGATVHAGTFTHNVAGTWTNTGTYNHGNGQVIFDPASLVTVDATAFYKLTVNAAGGGIILNGNLIVSNDLVLSGGDIQLSGKDLTVAGVTTISAGTFLTIGTGTFIFQGNVASSGSVTTSAGGTLKATGSNIQNWTGTSTPSIHNLWILKGGGTFNPAVAFQVSGTLTLDGIISNSGILTLASGATLVRTSGWVDGRISRNFSGASTLLYPLGTTNGYAPVSVTSAGSGTLDVKINAGAHPNNTGFGANQLQGYWSFYNTSLTGAVNLSFNWTAAMENGTPGTYVLGRHNGTSWSQPGGTTGAQTASITGVTSFAGDWTVGDPASIGGAMIFVITGPATATAGGSVTVTITAKDGNGNTATAYAGDKTIVMAGASSANDGVSDPTASNKTGTHIAFGNNTVMTFTAGVATTTLKLYAAETAFIEASEASGPSTQAQLQITIDPAAASKLAITSVDFLSTPFQNAPFDVNVQARDAWENPAPVTANTSVQLTLAACGGCTGTLGGNTVTTIYSGSDNDVIMGVTYSAAQANVVFTATRTGGDTLSSANSSAFTFAPQATGIAVTSSSNSGPGSLRDALTRNNNGECAAPCNITFNIAPAGAHEIVLAIDLPAIEQPATLDATTQPGYTGTPIIAIDGGAALGDGFFVQANGTTIKGFILHTFSGAGVYFDNADGGVVQNCWIGTNLTGTAGAGNWDGITLASADNATIGGSGANQGNVISGNFGSGIAINGNSGLNVIAGNYIGTNAAGTAAIPNNIGLYFTDSASNNTIGGSTAAHRNVISGNTSAGLYLEGSAPAMMNGGAVGDGVEAQPLIGNYINANAITNNFIGTNAAGNAALANGVGIELAGYCTANSVGQTGQGNLISGNTGNGIRIGGTNNNDNYIRANVIGLALDGVTPLANGGDGIEVSAGSPIYIGGTGGGDGNTIARNTGNGVTVVAGEDVVILGNSLHGNGGRGIDLGDDGADTQDDGAGDADSGANKKQNYPVIGSAQISGANLQLGVTMSSSATGAGSLRLQFFEADSLASGEGKSLLDGPCIAGNVINTSITVPAGSVTAGDPVVATATSFTDGACANVADGTSEFSPAATAASCTPPTATITASGPTTFCAGGSVTLTASNGSSWAWSNGATTQSIVVSASGTFSVTVTDGSGCSATSSSTTVTVNPVPTASITASGPTTFCAGGSVILTANTASSYLWSNGATTQSITVSASGTHSVQVTQGGCSATSATTTVTVNPIPTATVTASGPTTFCAGGSVTLTANTSDSYLWSNGATTRSITVTAAGSYSVQVTQNGCTSASSAATTVTVNPAPTATITASGATTFCAGGSVTLTANTSDSYLWSNGATTQSITVTSSGNYTVQVTQNGCMSAASAATTVTVNPAPSATVIPAGPTTFCAGGSVTLNASAGDSWLWSNGATTQSIVVTSSGSYSVQVTQNGCTSASSTPIIVTVNPAPTASITASGPTTFCAGGSVVLTANTSDSYLWSNGATTQSITVTAGGNYTVQVTQNGCTSAASAATTVTVNPAPAATITASGPTSFCTGGSVTLTASNGTSWLWSNGATTQSITVSASGSFSVQVTQNGCTATSATTNVTVSPAPAASITASGPTTFCAGGSVTLTASAGNGWLWSNGATTQSIVVSASGSYSVTVTDGNGCNATSAPTVVTVAATPDATITGPTSTCAGVAVTLTAGNGDSWLWSNGATTQSITVTPSSTTSYSVTVTSGSCSATDTHSVTVSATPTATITTPATVCANSSGNSASVAAQSGATYAWTITGGTITAGAGTSAITFTAGPSGNVLLGVTVQKGSCTSTGNSSSTITSGLTPTISGPSAVCPGSSFTLDAGAGYSNYLWSNGATTQTITVTQSTATQTYGVSVTSGGCSATATKTVNLSATANAVIDAPAQVDPSSSGHIASVPAGATSYTWNITNGTITAGQGTNAITFTAGSGGAVGLNVTVTNGSCTATGSTSVAIGLAEADLSVTKSGPSSVAPGGTIVYTINVTNHGPATASGLEIVDELPAGTSLVSVQSGFLCTFSVTRVVCSGSGFVGSMSPIVITVTAPSQPGTLTNTVRVSSNLPDPNPANNSASVATTVTSPTCGTAASPQIITPLEGSTGLTSPVTFSWTPVPQAIGYRLWASSGNAAPQQLGQTDGAITLTTAVPSGALTVFVEALFNNCPSSRSADLRISVITPSGCGSGIATPTSPANNSTVNSSSVTFQWLAAAGADGYRVWVSIDNAAPAVVGETTSETSLTATLARGSVQWWVEALYAGCASTESQRLRFTIPAAQQCSTDKPALIAPSAGANVPAGVVSFSWTAVPNALAYELWLSHENGTPILARTVAAPLTAVQHEVPAGRLQWFVRVLADRCPTRDSDARHFNATQPLSCDTNVRPMAQSPVEKAHVSAPVSFTWSASPGATSYELYVAHGNQAPQLVANSVQTSVSGIDLSNGRRRWFVRARFGQNCPPLDSSEQLLEVVAQPAACAPLDQPVMSAPGQISSGVPFSIYWSSVPGATSYQLEIASDASFANAESVTRTGTDHDLVRTNNGPAPVAVFLRVRAVDSRCANANVSAYGTTAIFILPPTAGEGAASAGDGGLVNIPIVLGSELAGQTFTATPTQPWLTVTPSTGTVPPSGITLTVKADTTSLPLGTSLGGVTVTTNGATGERVASQATSSTTPVSISIVTPVTPTPKNTPPPDALIIPAVAHADGINAKFQSDVRVSNTSPRVVKYQLTFTPSGESGITQGKQTTFSIDPGRTIALDDILKTWFGTGSTSVTGVLEVRPLTQTTTSTSSSAVAGLANLTTFASSRTYNMTANGTFGQFIPAIAFANFVGKASSNGAGSVLSLQQIAHSDRFRTNLGFVEGSGQPAALLVTVYGSNGAKVTSFPVNLTGGQHLQINGFLAQQGITSLNDGRVEVQVTSSTGKVTAYASVLDNDTADPLLVSPVTLSERGENKWVLPGVADLANGVANWQTDMRIFNAGTNAVEATLSFYSQRGGDPIVKTLTIPAGQVRELDRTLASVFGATNDGGAVHISTPSSERLIATARTYNQTSNGTYGQFISAVTTSEAAGVGSRPLQILQLEESDRYRSNIGFAEVSGKPVTLEVGIVPPNGKTSIFIEVPLAANEFRQLNSLLASAGLRDTHNARITVRALSGEGRAAAYASVVDMETQDPTYVPAQ